MRLQPILKSHLPPRECATKINGRPGWRREACLATNFKRRIMGLTHSLLSLLNSYSRSLACMDIWFLLTGPPKNLDTCDSYPQVRIRAPGQSEGKRSAGQKISPALTESFPRALCRVGREKSLGFCNIFGPLISSAVELLVDWLAVTLRVHVIFG